MKDKVNGLRVYARGEGRTDEAMGLAVGTVDRLDGDFIKLKRSDSPDRQHHWIPLEWVETVDADGVHLNQTIEQFRRGKFDSRPLRAVG